MTRPLVDFPDPMLATLAVLRAAGTAATFGTKTPDAFPAGSIPAPPYAMVAVDASSLRTLVAETVTLRVSVWGTDDVSGYALARHLRATLLAYAGDALVRSYAALTGPVPTHDPDDGKPLATFTVAARLRPTS